jgi:hypothetical protein
MDDIQFTASDFKVLADAANKYSNNISAYLTKIKEIAQGGGYSLIVSSDDLNPNQINKLTELGFVVKITPEIRTASISWM